MILRALAAVLCLLASVGVARAHEQREGGRLRGVGAAACDRQRPRSAAADAGCAEGQARSRRPAHRCGLLRRGGPRPRRRHCNSCAQRRAAEAPAHGPQSDQRTSVLRRPRQGGAGREAVAPRPAMHAFRRYRRVRSGARDQTGQRGRRHRARRCAAQVAAAARSARRVSARDVRSIHRTRDVAAKTSAAQALRRTVEQRCMSADGEAALGACQSILAKGRGERIRSPAPHRRAPAGGQSAGEGARYLHRRELAEARRQGSRAGDRRARRQHGPQRCARSGRARLFARHARASSRRNRIDAAGAGADAGIAGHRRPGRGRAKAAATGRAHARVAAGRRGRRRHARIPICNPQVARTERERP